MFSDVQYFRDLTHHDFTQLRFDGAQEYEDKFKKNFGFGINKKIKANRVERYNPKNDFTIQPPQSYTDEVGHNLLKSIHLILWCYLQVPTR
jgi:hypothetical protein